MNQNVENQKVGDAVTRTVKPVNPTTKFSWKKWLIITVIALLAIVIAVVMMSPKSVDAEVAMAEQGEVTVTVEEQGRTRARFPYTIAAPISGRLLRPELREGDRVHSGQVVARIAPPPTDARTGATARADLAAAKARQSDAQAARNAAASVRRLTDTQATRRVELFKTHVVSAEDRDNYVQAAAAAKDQLARANALLAAAAAEVDASRARLLGVGSQPNDDAEIEVNAPIDGVVLKVLEKSERVVPSGTPLFELGKGEAIELIIDVLSEKGVQVQAGDVIRVSGWGGDDVLTGKVRYVEPGAFTKVSALGVEEQRVNVIGDLDDVPPSLGAEFRIEAAIITWTSEVLRIPTGAMFRRDNAWQVFAISNDKAQLRKIEIGHRGNAFAEVLSGLEQGEKVILFPSDQIGDGVKINAPAQATPQPGS